MQLARKGRKGSNPSEEGLLKKPLSREQPPCPPYSLKRGLFQQPRRPRVCRLKNERLTRPERRAARGQTLPSRSGLSPHSDFPSPEDPTVSPEPKRRTNSRVSSAHPRDWMQLPFPGRADPHAWPQFLGLPSELTPARRIRPGASAPKREAARRPPPDSPVASTNKEFLKISIKQCNKYTCRTMVRLASLI